MKQPLTGVILKSSNCSPTYLLVLSRRGPLPGFFNNNAIRQAGGIVPFRILRPFFTGERHWEEYERTLKCASKMATSSMAAFSKIPLLDITPTENGKIFIEGELNGITRMGGLTKDQLVRAGATKDAYGYGMEKGFCFVDVIADDSYTILINNRPAEALRRSIVFHHGQFEAYSPRNDEKFLNWLGGLESYAVFYEKPGTVSPGYGIMADGAINPRYSAYIGDFGYFGAAVELSKNTALMFRDIKEVMRVAPDQKALIETIQGTLDRTFAFRPLPRGDAFLL